MPRRRVLTHDEAPWLAAPESRAVVAALTADGAPARFVGGCVRDALAGRQVTDIDIATPEPPRRVMELLAGAGLKAIPTGLEHGTVTALAGGRSFEITTLRCDVETDGRRAVVAFTADWDEDAARRDFTINAMSTEPDGTVHDPFGGIADLAAGRVRFVGDPETRIREDVLRILRFFRFHAHYGRGAPDPAAFASCRQLAPLLPGLSGERVAGELRRLLKAADAAAMIEQMRDAGVLDPILPELADTARLRGLQGLDEPVARDPLLRLAALLPADAAAAATIADRLRLANVERARLEALASPPPALWPARDDRALRRALYHLGGETVRDLGLLASASGDRALGRAATEAARHWAPVALPVRGQDALDLGVAPGPEVGRLIGEVESWWEENDFRPDRDACLARLKELTRPTRA
ncbi:MAG TPA: CCA tRNA nucleotidyltransferase [Alphaproteobacteria bacterium]